jgi:hypothetical protein
MVMMRLGRAPEEGLGPEAQELVAAIADARGEYRRAINYFHCVSQPELVEHAVLLLAAAECRYAYLLGQARQTGIRLPWTAPLEG